MNALWALLKSTFINNPLAIAVTIFGVMHFGDEFIIEPIKEWQLKREWQTKNTAIIERCLEQNKTQQALEGEVDEATNSDDNSFINQRVSD